MMLIGQVIGDSIQTLAQNETAQNGLAVLQLIFTFLAGLFALIAKKK